MNHDLEISELSSLLIIPSHMDSVQQKDAILADFGKFNALL